MSDANQKSAQPQTQNVSNADLLREIKSLAGTVGVLASKVEALESKGKNDKEVEPPSRKNYNDDPGPYVKPVYDKKCVQCKRDFKTDNAGVAVCPDCALAKRDKDTAKLDQFNQE